jgi:hypothetical protein
LTSELVPWRGHNVPVLSQEISRYNISDYIRMITEGGYGLHAPIPVQTTYGRQAQEPIANNFPGFVEGLLYSNGPVAAAEAYRLRVFGQAPLLYQETSAGRPGDFFDDDQLDLLRSPWPAGTLSDLMKRTLVHGDLGGNGFGAVIDDEIVLLRPDWVKIVLAKRMHNGVQVGWRQIGIAYAENGVFSGDFADSEVATFLPGEYFHFVPGLPDPLATYRGMSWLTPIVREVMADKAASEHKLKFFENAATANLVVKTPAQMTPEQFKSFVALMREQHDGVQNAYKTLYLGDGADADVIGANMQEMDFSAVQGKGETRIANAAGVPPVLLSFSEGMQGSSLNAGNYQAAKRSFVDTTMRDLWQNWCGSLLALDQLKPPREKSRLWYDPRDIPFLHEDQQDAATIRQTNSAAISSLITSGFTPKSAVSAVVMDDLSLLEHTGLTSVQLLPPGARDTDGDGSVDVTDADVEEEAEAEDEYLAALNAARAEFDEWEDVILRFEDEWDEEVERARYNIRRPAGVEGGGRFRKISEVIFSTLEDWMNGGGDDDPLEPFDREQLRQAAKQLGLPLERGIPKPKLKKLLLDKAMADVRAQRDVKAPDVPDVPDAPDVAKVRESRFANTTREQAEALLTRLPAHDLNGLGDDGKRTRKDLADLARLLGLPTSGTKGQLAGRIHERAQELRGERESLEGGDAPKAVTKVTKSKAALPSGSDVEIAESFKALSLAQKASGDNLTPAGRRAVDAIGATGHPRIAAIPDTEGKIREAHRMLALPGGGSDSYVALSDVRKLLGEQVPRSEVDDTLRQMMNAPDVRIEAQSYRRQNAAIRIPAALMVGGGELNLLHIDDPSLVRPRQLAAVDMAQELVNRRDGGPRNPMMASLSDADLRAEVDRRIAQDAFVAGEVSAKAPTYRPETKLNAPPEVVQEKIAEDAAPAGVAAKLNAAKTRDEARELLKGKTRAELVDIAKAANVAHSSKATKASIEADLVQWTVGHRLTSDAISGHAAGSGLRKEAPAMKTPDDPVSVKEHSSGRLHVTSPYDKAFIDGVKKLDGKWLAKSKSWSVPGDRADELQSLIDRTYGGPVVPVTDLPSAARIGTRANGKIAVSAPFNDAFRAEARALGGAWDPTAKEWVFPPHREQQVRAAAARHYGREWQEAQAAAREAETQAREAHRQAQLSQARTPTRMSTNQRDLIKRLIAKHAHRRSALGSVGLAGDMFWHDFFDGAGGPQGQYSAGGPTSGQLESWLDGMDSRTASALIDDLIAWGKGY